MAAATTAEIIQNDFASGERRGVAGTHRTGPRPMLFSRGGGGGGGGIVRACYTS